MPITRREFADISWRIGLAAIIAACSKEKELEEWIAIEPGSSKELQYFTFSNQMSDYLVKIHDGYLKRVAEEFKTPLETTQSLKVSLLPDIKFEQSDKNYGSDLQIIPCHESQSEIRIAEGASVERFRSNLGNPPYPPSIERLFSMILSLNINNGLCQLAYQKNSISKEEASSRATNYFEYLMEDEQPILFAQMHSQNPPPPSPYPTPPNLPPNAKRVFLSKFFSS
jgi:hypothetical protein